jgi:hypothetical protein
VILSRRRADGELARAPALAKARGEAAPREARPSTEVGYLEQCAERTLCRLVARSAPVPRPLRVEYQTFILKDGGGKPERSVEIHAAFARDKLATSRRGLVRRQAAMFLRFSFSWLC